MRGGSWGIVADRAGVANDLSIDVCHRLGTAVSMLWGARAVAEVCRIVPTRMI